jgi:hypothetical protein
MSAFFMSTNLRLNLLGLPFTFCAAWVLGLIPKSNIAASAPQFHIFTLTRS